MLTLRPDCECCDRDLPADSRLAMICTFECTFYIDCVETRLGGHCPTCGGEFVRRPVRRADWLAHQPRRSGPSSRIPGVRGLRSDI